jgi:prepilin-type N-terminal cleavage/methylation domain-containing protein
MSNNLKELNSSTVRISKRGFTLIEILIVVAIIGLLASVVLVGLGAFRTRGRDARRIADLRETQNALELYYTKNQRYPALGGGESWLSLTSSLINAGIGVSNISNDPLYPDKTYRFGVASDGQSYVLAASLEDSSNPALKDDADGSIYSIDCDDPTYCVQF